MTSDNTKNANEANKILTLITVLCKGQGENETPVIEAKGMNGLIYWGRKVNRQKRPMFWSKV